MDIESKKFWPFDVLPPEQQTGLHKSIISFLEESYSLGYSPFLFDTEDLGATAGDREGLIIWRTRNRWEVRLSLSGDIAESFYVNDFIAASESVRLWLSGENHLAILEKARIHIISKSR